MLFRPARKKCATSQHTVERVNSVAECIHGPNLHTAPLLTIKSQTSTMIVQCLRPWFVKQHSRQDYQAR